VTKAEALSATFSAAQAGRKTSFLTKQRPAQKIDAAVALMMAGRQAMSDGGPSAASCGPRLSSAPSMGGLCCQYSSPREPSGLKHASLP
jgi:hypothetical protein